MKIQINLLEKEKLEAHFDGFTVHSDQPTSNKGENLAPSPFDYFLVSTALCAGYFVKAYCNSRNLPYEKIVITQENIKDIENKYKQTFNILIKVPEDFSEKDKEGIRRSVENCSVKKAIMNQPEFKIDVLSDKF